MNYFSICAFVVITVSFLIFQIYTFKTRLIKAFHMKTQICWLNLINIFAVLHAYSESLVEFSKHFYSWDMKCTLWSSHNDGTVSPNYLQIIITQKVKQTQGKLNLHHLVQKFHILYNIVFSFYRTFQRVVDLVIFIHVDKFQTVFIFKAFSHSVHTYNHFEFIDFSMYGIYQ